MAKVPVKLAGIGPQMSFLRKLSEEIGSKTNFLGYLNGEDLHNAVRSARASVLPSEWYENAPMSILESYGLGTPVIGAAIGGSRNLSRTESLEYFLKAVLLRVSLVRYVILQIWRTQSWKR